MRLGALLLCLSVLAGGATLVPSAGAQVTIVPTVNISCDPTDFELDVYLRHPAVVSRCTAENPTPYIEEVSLEVSADITYSGPGSLILYPGGSEEFEIFFMGYRWMDLGVLTATMTYRVESANSVANPIAEDKVVDFRFTVLPFSMPRLHSDASIVVVSGMNEVDLGFNVHNDGNDIDRFEFEVQVPEGWSLASVTEPVEVVPQQYAPVTVVLAREGLPTNDTVDVAIDVCSMRSAQRGHDQVCVRQHTLLVESLACAAGSALGLQGRFCVPMGWVIGGGGSGLLILGVVLVWWWRGRRWMDRQSDAGEDPVHTRRARTRAPAD